MLKHLYTSKPDESTGLQNLLSTEWFMALYDDEADVS